MIFAGVIRADQSRYITKLRVDYIVWTVITRVGSLVVAYQYADDSGRGACAW